MNPHQLEKKLEALESAFIQWLTQRSNLWLRLILLALVLAVLFGVAWPYWQKSFPDWSRFVVAQDRTWLGIVLGLFGFLSFLIPPNLFLPYLAVMSFAAWGQSIYLMLGWSWVQLLMPLYLLSNFFALKVSRGWLRTSMIIILFGMLIYSAGWWALRENMHILRFFWILHPEYLFFFFVYWSLAAKDQRERAAFTPINCMSPLPLPLEVRIEKSKSAATWWKGGIKILWAEVMFIPVMIMALSHPSGWGSFFSGAYRYLYFCLFVSATMNLCTGLLLISGIEVPAATRYLLLASSPMDLWRRGSTYVYRMVFEMIFLPMARQSRSVLLASMICLIFVLFQLFWFHEIGIRSFYGLLFPQLAVPSNMVAQTLLETSKFAGAWIFLAVIFEFLVRRPFSSHRSSVRDWLEVILNHLFVIGVLSSINWL